MMRVKKNGRMEIIRPLLFYQINDYFAKYLKNTESS